MKTLMPSNRLSLNSQRLRSTKQTIEAMYQVTGLEYRTKEKEIDFFQLLEQLAKIGLQSSKFICEKVTMSQEINTINEALLGK